MRFPRRCLLFAAMLIAGSLFLAACGGEEEAATPTPSATAGPGETASPGPSGALPTREGPERGLPPAAVLRAGDARQTGALGTFCWTWGCADTVGIIVPTEPLAVAPDEPLIFELGFDPTGLRMVVWRSNQGEVWQELSGDAFAWAQGPSEEPVLEERPPPARTIELRPDLPPGTYIVGLFAGAVGADVSYGFHVEIVP